MLCGVDDIMTTLDVDETQCFVIKQVVMNTTLWTTIAQLRKQCMQRIHLLSTLQGLSEGIPC